MQKRRITFLVAFIAASLASVAASLAAATPVHASTTPCPGADSIPAALTLEQYDAALLCLLNAERANAGLRPLRANRKLARAALGHSAAMATRSYFSHTDPSGTTFDARIGRAGYKRGARHWFLGENLGMGVEQMGSPGEIVKSWMESPEHRRNILDGSFRDIGIGTARGAPLLTPSSQGVTITTDFGLRTRG
jgi:uncharacterized protein YkwD